MLTTLRQAKRLLILLLSQSVWLSKALQKRIDAFHYIALRIILGIPHSFISRVSNAEVLRRSCDAMLHTQLLRQQLLYYGRLVRNDNHPARYLLEAAPTKRRPGRPHLSWASELRNHIQNMSCDPRCIDSKIHWREVVNEYY